MAYDSRTDRADFSGPRWSTDTPWHFRSAAGADCPKGKRALKRAASKRDRHSPYPRAGFRGYGYGEQNMASCFW